MHRSAEIPKWVRALGSCLVAAAVCGFLMLCVHIGNTDDDWSIAFYLSNRLPGTGLSLYINALLSQLIHGLNMAIPRFSWFFVAEYASVWLALSAALYSAVSYVRKTSAAVFLSFLMLYILPYCIAESNFTYVAGFCAAIGGLMLVAQVGRKGVGWFARAVAIVLCCLGLMWRSKMLLMLTPFIAAAYCWRLWGVVREEGVTLRSKRLLAIILPAVLSVVCCLGLTGYDRLVWQRDGWQQWRSYDSVRSVLSDFPMPPYDEVASELSSLGISENDYYMLLQWGNADVDVLNKSVVESVTTLQEPPIQGPKDILRAAWQYTRGSLGKWKFFALIVFALVAARYKRKGTYGIAALELAIAGAECAYFLALGRLLPRVEDPAWACALAMCVALSAEGALAEGGSGALEVDGDGAAAHMKAPHVSRAHQAWGVGLACCASLVLVATSALQARRIAPFMDAAAFRATLHQDTYVSDGSLSQYFEAFPQATFVMETTVHTRYELEYGFRYFPTKELAPRVMPLGGWGSGSPFRKAQCELVGASNPYQALISNDNTFLISDEGTSQRVLTFLQEHYDSNVTCARIMKFPSEDGSINMWKFMIAG